MFRLFCMHIFIVQHIALDFRSMRYIKIDIIIIIACRCHVCNDRPRHITERSTGSGCLEQHLLSDCVCLGSARIHSYDDSARPHNITHSVSKNCALLDLLTANVC